MGLGLFHCLPNHPVKAFWLYTFSFALDMVDGPIAKYLNQMSVFGTLLDTMSDRGTLLCMLARLCLLYPRHAFLLIGIACTDVSSQWMHGYSSLLLGSRTYQTIGLECMPFLSLPKFTKKVIFCGSILCYGLLYFTTFTKGPRVPGVKMGLWQVICIGCSPFAALQVGKTLVELGEATLIMAALDAQKAQKTGIIMGALVS
ncbi:CDP-diacylglycerol--inositol 3-phosphatidyltransferase-like [Lingula anatina]|uniref:CDP-diacylglycerol--inositol 3-phosphatidyltransferase-like n=1 Tax=Lingula anatina TaxID=7574 RepID=A0A1S3HKN1_LINAN|nr:CDP-diacylglycerol--inositol 3-phosphatidyltransferase-like [Lingula anatina]|eukprot:XP_013386670.1 CDP-diacylglycerol--inositol 3-phosphatidyltransferase-like [Lingula anatina]